MRYGLNRATVIGFATIVALPQTATATLLISEVVDGTLPGGLPKYVELTNTGTSTLDMSGYSLAFKNNGNTTFSTFNSLSGMLIAGDSFVISLENGDSAGNSTFFDTYGFDADHFNFGAVANGNDVVELYEGPGATLLDVYGVVGVDGTGEVWDYADGYATRNAGVLSGNSTFDPSEWFFSGPDALDGGSDAGDLALILANTTPGAHDPNTAAVPLPLSGALLGLGLLGLGAVRHRT